MQARTPRARDSGLLSRSEPANGRVSKVGAPRDYEVCLNCGEELAVTVFTEPLYIKEPQEVGVFRDAKELL